MLPIILDIYEFVATENAQTDANGNSLKAYEDYIKSYVSPSDVTAYCLFENNSDASSYKARAIFPAAGVSGTSCGRGTSDPLALRLINQGISFYYTAGTKITTVILKDLTDW